MENREVDKSQSARMMPPESAKRTILAAQVKAAFAGHDIGPFEPVDTVAGGYQAIRVPLRRIQAIINPQLAKPLSYSAYRYFVIQDAELYSLWKAHK